MILASRSLRCLFSAVRSRETLSGELFVEARDLLVEWLELLLLRDLCPEELVIEDLELELNGIAASLLLVLELVLDVTSHALLSLLTQLLLLSELDVQCQALLVHLLHHLCLELLACLLLVGNHVCEPVDLVVEALEDGLLSVEPVLALLVDTVCNADDLICNLLLVAVLSLLAELLLAGKVEAQSKCGLVNLLH